MKMHFLTIMVCLVAMTAHASNPAPKIQQNYTKFYNVGDWWIEGAAEYDWTEQTEDVWDFFLYKYTIEDVSVINGKQYVSVSEQLFDYYNQKLTVYPKIYNAFYIREDGFGKQYVWLPVMKGEFLLWDFSSDFKVDGVITCGYINSRDSNPQYYSRQIKINEVCTYELINGSQIDMINSYILKGFGNLYSGISYNLGETDMESMGSEFLLRYCKGEKVLQNDLFLNSLTRMMGQDFIQMLTDKATNLQTLYSNKLSTMLYDLSGRHVGIHLFRGLYIVDGKKVWVK